jgi:hypothetical protein
MLDILKTPFCAVLRTVCNSSLFSSCIFECCLNPAVFTKTFFPTLKAMWYVTFCILYYCDVCTCVCVCCFFNSLVPDVKCTCDAAWYSKCQMRSTARGSPWLLLCGSTYTAERRTLHWAFISGVKVFHTCCRQNHCSFNKYFSWNTSHQLIIVS